MEVDDDGSQHPAKINDFGVEPDFDVLEEDDKEVFRNYVIAVNADSARMVERNTAKTSRSG